MTEAFGPAEMAMEATPLIDACLTLTFMPTYFCALCGVPLRRLPTFTVFGPGDYAPHELGLPFREVRRVSIGACGIGEAFEVHVIGHSHLPMSVICVRDGRYVLNGPAEPSETMWHEYAHVLTALADGVDHGPLWRAKMASFGFPAATEHADYFLDDNLDAPWPWGEPGTN